jgi:hypothetical protein
MSENMEIFNQVKDTPTEAQSTIPAGRLKGFTDINPMWRIKKLTELFGPCGIGWWYVIKDKKVLEGANNEVKVFLSIDLFYKWNGETSQPIPGEGGSSFISNEKGGLYVNDECFKMALTDAIGTACKSLGFSEDIHSKKYTSKYNMPQPKHEQPNPQQPKIDYKKEIDEAVSFIAGKLNMDVKSVQLESIKRAGSQKTKALHEALIKWKGEINESKAS